MSPDEQAVGDIDFNDPEVDVIMIADRTDADQAAIDQLPDSCS
jgi:hypothetical protein